MVATNTSMPDVLKEWHAKRAVVIAHPDDEALWFAGLMIRYPGDWTVICCSIPVAERDPIRGYKFFTSCERLCARGRLLPFPESKNKPLDTLQYLNLDGFDMVVTHGEKGEYGHPHHCQVHRYLRERCAGKLLSSCYGGEISSFTVSLNSDEWDRKLAAIQSYDHVMHWLRTSKPPITSQALLDEFHHGKFNYNLGVEKYAQH